MKLNLLPTHISKEKTAKAGVVIGVLTAMVGVVAAVGMIVISKQLRADAHAKMVEKEPQAARVVALAKEADAIIEKARPVILNINLANEMNKHNSVYPNVYDEVRRYIPSFFRITSMSLAPGGEATTVNLTGVLQTQQQYADLMLALLRFPGAASVSRDGYQIVSPAVPALSTTDQTGRPLRPGETQVPDNPQDRLNYYIAQGQLTGFDGTGGFGGDPTAQRGAMPNWSEIAVSVVIPRNVATPNPRATLAAGGAGGPTPAPNPAQTGGGRGAQAGGGGANEDADR